MFSKDIFSKNIFQIWYQGKENIPNETFKENVKNWEVLNPDWKYVLADDAMLKKVCGMFSQKCLNAYNRAKAMHTKIDLGKIVLVYLYGGIAVDIDMYVLRSLNSSEQIKQIISDYNYDQKHVLGLSKLNITNIESVINSGYPSMFNNAVFLASPKNPLLKKWIETVIDNISHLEKKNYDKMNYVAYTSGPIVLNKFIYENKNINLSKIITFEPIMFEPCDFINSCQIENNTIAIHNFELSWLSETEKKLANFYYKYIRYNILSIVLFFVIVYLIFRKV